MTVSDLTSGQRLKIKNNVLDAIKSNGGELVKLDDTGLYLEITESSKLDNDELLSKLNRLIKTLFKVPLKYKLTSAVEFKVSS